MLLDYEALDAWNAKMTIAYSNANLTEKAFVFAALFQWHSDKPNEAKEFVQKALQMEGSSVSAHVLMGWIEMTSGNDKVITKSNAWFENALDKNPRELEVL